MWEYKTIVEVHEMNRMGGSTRIEPKLRELGREGWELVTVLNPGRIRAAEWVFKRRKARRI